MAAPKEGARDNGKGEITCLTPDVCLKQVGNAVMPTPFMSTATLDATAAKTTSTVRLGGDEAYNKASHVTETKGDGPGDKKGIKSGTVGDKVEPLTHSGTVNFEGKSAVRHGDTCYMNNKNTCGELDYPGNKSLEIVEPSVQPEAQLVQMTLQGTGGGSALGGGYAGGKSSNQILGEAILDGLTLLNDSLYSGITSPKFLSHVIDQSIPGQFPLPQPALEALIEGAQNSSNSGTNADTRVTAAGGGGPNCDDANAAIQRKRNVVRGRREDMLRDRENQFNNAYDTPNPNSDTGTTWLSHINAYREAQAGLRNAMTHARRHGCEIQDANQVDKEASQDPPEFHFWRE